MRVVLLLFLSITVGAQVFDSTEPTIEGATNEEGKGGSPHNGYDIELDAVDTKKFLEQLHDMEDEINDELSLSEKQNAELLKKMEDYVEIKKDHVEPMGDTIEEINHNSNVDTVLFQGDMILTKEQIEEAIEDIKENEGSRRKRQAFRDENYPKTLWPNGVYYSFYSNASQAARRVFRKATVLWSLDTCINFKESNTAADRITVIAGTGCYSFVGRTGGVQILSLGTGCEMVGIAAHEIGHALGFFHTQARHDRDMFITLYRQNFLPGWLSQFTKQTRHTNYNYNLTYDYGSIMHYGATVVSKNGQPVMVSRDLKYMQTLGSPMISFYEKLMMNLHYKCLDKCTTKSSATCRNGGFPHPRDCSKCICPSGYGGRLCGRRPIGCGKTLKATNSFQTLKDTVDVATTSDEFTMCNYWIKAPVGSKIEVVLDSYAKGTAIDGCIYAGVEIKTGKDKRHTGYRFCAPENVGTSLVSTYNIVPVITYSRVPGAKTVLRYRIVSSGSRSTRRPTSRSTRRPRPNPSNPCCQDGPMCPALMKVNFCNSSNYNERLKKMLCPKSCGFC